MRQEYIDISTPISPEGVVWPGAPKTEFTSRRSMSKGDRSNNSNFLMNCHTGTHVDAPLHFINEGASTETLSLEAMIGEALVIDVSQAADITVSDLEKFWVPGTERVLFKTRNVKWWESGSQEFIKDFCALKEEATRWLLQKKIKLVGIDYFSIQIFGDSPIVHQLLLGEGVVVLEGIDLSKVAAGKYELLCLPLKLVGLEGSPARAVLRKCS